MNYQHTSDEYWETSPAEPGASEGIDDEMDRWKKLLERPLSLEANILRYGELTIYGYYVARETLRVNASCWPVDPIAIAQLLTTCAIASYEIEDSVARHAQFFKDDDNKAGIAVALRVHVELLKLRDIPRTPEALLKVTPFLEWDRISYRERFESAFEVMHQYLHSASDEALFLKGWLPHLRVGRDFYGTDSLGVMLARAFQGPDVSALATWCLNRDDQQGIAYLVWQNRLPFREWLRDVAFSTRPAANRDRHSPNASLSRRREQTECLGRLYGKISLKQEYQDLLSDEPTLLTSLVDLAMDRPDEAHSISWMGYLLGLNALTPEHPLFEQWVSAALTAQDVTIKSLRVIRLTATFLAMYTTWEDLFEHAGAECKSLIARHLVLHLRVTGREPAPADAVGDLSWLQSASVAPALLALFSDTITSEPAHSLTKLFGLYPYLCSSERSSMAAFIATWVAAGKMPVKTILEGLNIPAQVPIERSGTNGDALYLLKMATGKDTTSLQETLNVFSIDPSDPLYESTLRDWLNKAFSVDVVVAPLPALTLD